MLSRVTIVAVVFATWELVENRFFRDLDYGTLHMHEHTPLTYADE